MEILKDTRNKAYDATTAAPAFDANRFANEATRLTVNLGHTVTSVTQKLNRFTGHVTELKAENAPAFAAALTVTLDQQYVDTALEFAKSVSAALGFEAGEPAEFDADPNVQKVSEDMRAVSLKQTYRSIGVWGMEPKVWFKGSAVERLVGDTVSLPKDLPVVPTVTAEAAVRAGALEAAKPRTQKDPFTGNEEDVPGVDVSQYVPQRLASFADPAQKMVFPNGPFADDVPVELVYFYTGGAARLAWKMTFILPDFSSKYLVIVEADDRAAAPDAPEVLYMSDQAHRASVRGRVFMHNPGEGAIAEVSFPRPTGEYPVPSPSDLPPG